MGERTGLKLDVDCDVGVDEVVVVQSGGGDGGAESVVLWLRSMMRERACCSFCCWIFCCFCRDRREDLILSLSRVDEVESEVLSRWLMISWMDKDGDLVDSSSELSLRLIVGEVVLVVVVGWNEGVGVNIEEEEEEVTGFVVCGRRRQKPRLKGDCEIRELME